MLDEYTAFYLIAEVTSGVLSANPAHRQNDSERLETPLMGCADVCTAHSLRSFGNQLL
jgi:hypothetical protein